MKIPVISIGDKAIGTAKTSGDLLPTFIKEKLGSVRGT